MDIVSLDDLTPRRLGPGISPVWSPQGTWIAFRDGSGLSIIHPHGSNGHQISRTATGSGFAFTAPQWSMDERYVTFYAGPDGDHDVWVARADKPEDWPIGTTPQEEYWPSFSPDGTRVAFQRDLPGQSLAFNYVVTDPDGSNTVDVPSPMLLPGLPGVWAPDGSRLLGLHKTAPGAVELYQVDPAGLAEPVVIPIDTDWVNVSWQRVAP
ncbi:MAG: LpqB family beta-propeller domain-containing protein [Chloroflexota bacterium]